MKTKLMLLFTPVLIMLITVSARAGTLTVGKSGAEYTSIQAAILAAEEGDVIQVGPGTYREPIFITTDDLYIFGSGAGSTIIESPRTVITYLSIVGGGLEGFTLMYTGTNPMPTILVRNSSPTIIGNEITGGTLAGVEIGDNSNVLLQQNEIHANQGNGVLVHNQSSVVIEHNRIWQNGLEESYAGLEVSGGSTALLEYNTIWLNGGSGVYAHEASEIKMTGNHLIGNGLNGVSITDGASGEIQSNSVLWNAQVGVHFNEAQNITLDNNLIAHHVLGVLSDSGSNLQSQASNLFVENGTDVVGIGLTFEDSQANANALFHPRNSELLLTLARIGENLSPFPQELSDEFLAELVGQIQTAEIIIADVYRLAGQTEAAITRLNLVIALNPSSQAATQAKNELITL